MKLGDPVLVAHRLLDEQLVDSEGKRCGRVDDLELSGEPPRITALLVGKGLYPRRLPKRLRSLARHLTGEEEWGSNVVRVPWEVVDDVDQAVHLKGKAEEHGLGEGDDPSKWMVRRLPWN